MAPEKIKSKKKRTIWQRYRIAIVAGGLVLIGLFGAVIKFALSAKPSVHKPPNIMAVQLPKPPPPPTPPPPTPPPEPPKPEEKTIPQEQPKEEPKPVEKPPEAPPALGSAIKGDGNDGFGLSGSGDGVIGGIGSGGGGGDAKRWYAGQVQARAADALRNHKLTRSAVFGGKVRIWVDAEGRITKVTLSGSTGNTAIDNAISNEIFSGLQLEQAPPGGKPMYVDMRLGARRPK